MKKIIYFVFMLTVGMIWSMDTNIVSVAAAQSTPSATSTNSTKTPSATDLLNKNGGGTGAKSDLTGQSVNNPGSTKQPTINGTAAMQGENKGSSVSGNVDSSGFVGASNLGDDYGMGECNSGNVFQQLGCRAGVVGGGLREVAYMIAGFGLIVFAFAAIFGKVKWPLFVTVVFCCFLLSVTVYVVNTMTKTGDASWIGGVRSNGSSYSQSASSVPATDSGGVPAGESPK